MGLKNLIKGQLLSSISYDGYARTGSDPGERRTDDGYFYAGPI